MSCSTCIDYSSPDRFKTYSYFLTDDFLTITRGPSDTEVKDWALNDISIKTAQNEAAEYLSSKIDRTKQELINDWNPNPTRSFFDPEWADENYDSPAI